MAMPTFSHMSSPEAATMPFTHGRALIIGVGSYQHEPGLNVSITAADAPS